MTDTSINMNTDTENTNTSDSSTEETATDGLCGFSNHEVWGEFGPYYCIILYPDCSYRVCACIDGFPEDPSLTKPAYKCIDWDYYNDFWVVPEFTIKSRQSSDHYFDNHNHVSSEYGMIFNYTDYHDYKYKHDIFPIKKLSWSLSDLKIKIKRLLRKDKFHRESNINILAELIHFEYRNDPYVQNALNACENFSEVKDISAMPKIYGPVLIHSNTCWRSMDYKNCNKAIEIINTTYKKYMYQKWKEHLQHCGK